MYVCVCVTVRVVIIKGLYAFRYWYDVVFGVVLISLRIEMCDICYVSYSYVKTLWSALDVNILQLFFMQIKGYMS